MTTWRMRIACWIPKAKNTLSEYTILIAFPQLQWLHESVSILRIRILPVLLLWIPRPMWTRAASFLRFLDHIKRRTTVGRVSLDE